MPKDKIIKIEIELHDWIVQRAVRGGCQTRRILEDELGTEAFKRLAAEAKK